jgi:alpha-glucosidase
MYTCLLRVHKEGGTCFDPLMFHYPQDDNNFNVTGTEHTFLVGDAIKVSPVLEANATMITSYFPNGFWVNLNDYSKVVNASGNDTAQGEYIQLDAMNGINAHLRPGYMIPKESCMNGNDSCMTTTDLRTNGKISMVANRDS